MEVSLKMSKTGNIGLVVGLLIAGIFIVIIFASGAISNIFNAFSGFGFYGLLLGFLLTLIIIFGIINAVTKNGGRR